MLKLVPFNFIQPSKLLLGLGPYDYVAVDETGRVLGRGRNKDAVLETPGIFGYFNLKEAAPIDAENKTIPSFDDKPFGSLGPIQTIPGMPLIETVTINRPDLVEAEKPKAKKKPSLKKVK